MTRLFGQFLRSCLPFLLLAALYPACAVAQSGTGTPVTVQLNWKHQFEFAAFYAAQAQGYYRQAGLDVSIREGGPGIDAVREVVEGRADFGVGTSALVVERYRGQPVVALATLMQHSPIALIALRSRGIHSVHDLAGQPVAVDPHSRDEIEAFLLASGIPPSGIRLIDQTDWTLASLQTGREAAKVIYTSNETFLIRGREHDYLQLQPRSAGIDLFGNMLFTTDAQLQQNEARAIAFRDATLRGLVYALDHPDVMADLIRTQYNTQDKSREHLMFEAAQIRELTRPDIIEPGYMSPGRWRHVVSVYADRGKLPRDFDLRPFIHDPTPARLPNWVKPALFGTLSGLIVALLLLLRLRRLNRRLAQEVVERQAAESRLAESEHFLSSVIDNEPECVKLLNPQGQLLQINRAGLAMIEADHEQQVLGKPVNTLILPPHQAAFDDFQARILAGQSGSLSFEIRGLKGTRRWLESHAVPMRDPSGAVVSLLSVTRDISERKQRELEREQYGANLERQVALRTRELEEARRQAERLSQVKSEFLANMSHEIRTPLNGVLGMAAIGVRNSSQQPQLRDTFTKIQSSGKLLLGILNDVLDFSKIEAGMLRIETTAIDLNQLLDTTLGLLRERAEEKGLRLVLAVAADCPRHGLGDPLRLQQILLNLLSNAIKFTERGEVCVSVQGLDHHQLSLCVSDTGVGIDSIHLERIFSPFEQADGSTTRRFGGTGLGLTITHRLVTLMSGSIKVCSQPGIGSQFTVRLPWPPAPQPSLPEPLPAALAQNGPRLAGLFILVAEDNAINQIVITENLQEEGATVALVEDGEQAVQRVEKEGERFDVVLMDLQMPVMSGYEATRLIRQLAPDLPIIGQTAHAFGEERAACLAAGMVEHLAKPIDPDALVAAILRHRRQR